MDISSFSLTSVLNVDPGSKFDVVRAIWIILYYTRGCLSLIVCVWLVYMTKLYFQKNKGFEFWNYLNISITILALSSAMNSFGWIPAHFLQGLGFSEEARSYGQSMSTYFFVVEMMAAFSFVMLIFIMFTKVKNYLHLVSVIFLFWLLGGLAWLLVGGFSFKYV